MKLQFFFLAIGVLLAGACSNKGPYSYFVCVNEEGKTSQLITHENDSSNPASGQSILTGKVIDAETRKPIEHAVLALKKDTSKEMSLGTKVDSLGNFTLALREGVYQVYVVATGYTTFRDTLSIKNNKERHADIELGVGSLSITYLVDSDKKLSKRQLKRKRKELAAK